MKLKITLIILAGFVCAVMTASAFSADGSINLDGGEANNVPSSKSTVIGNQNTVPHDNSVVIGQQNETKQYNTSENHPRIIIGDKNQANAGAIILGEGGVADEQSVVVGGDASKALGVAVGNGSKGGYNAVSVGQGATTEKASFGVAVGAESAALSSGPQGQGSVAVGTRATAGYGGVALGYGANATNGGVALGTGSLTARFDEVNMGERFISGVKAGTSKTDAANVGQVQVSNANTLAAANAHSDTGNADTLRAARSHTDERETATNARTDALLKVEQTARNEAIANESLARRDGDAATLKAANDYTNWRVDTLNIDTADTLRQSQTYTDTRANEARHYTDSKFSQLNTRIDRAEKRLHAGIAGIAAMASIPYVASNRFSYGVAVGNYQNANALAGGIQYKTSPNTAIRLNVSLDSSHNAALAVGVNEDNKMSNNPSDKKYCYRYYDAHDGNGRPIVMLWKRVIIRETEKTFWHVEDMPYMTYAQLVKYRTGGRKESHKYHVKRCLKGADRSSYHYTKAEALRAFVYRKTYQIEKIQLAEETARMCLDGLCDAGMITGEYRCTVKKLPEGEMFIAANEPGPIAEKYTWGY